MSPTGQEFSTNQRFSLPELTPRSWGSQAVSPTSTNPDSQDIFTCLVGSFRLEVRQAISIFALCSVIVLFFVFKRSLRWLPVCHIHPCQITGWVLVFAWQLRAALCLSSEGSVPCNVSTRSEASKASA